MAKLTSFQFITLNGFYKGSNEDISWHPHGGNEEASFSEESAQSGNTLLFGRVTYEMMKSFWPTPMALEQMPAMAKAMNKAKKIVFSKTLTKVDWENTCLLSDHMIDAIKNLKMTSDKDITILGSGTILSQCTDAGLIDEYQFMLDPVAIGTGTPVFNNIQQQLSLKLISSRTFKSGAILLSYEPIHSDNTF